jgi:cobalamin biosynthesis Mg chelatase CobN
MHLLATEPGIIADGSAAIDLAQTPGDIIVLASADTEIALLAAAQARRREDDPHAPTVRLAPVIRLGHNFSVDLYMEVAARARLVIVRLLGGSAYWPYGVERLVETCRDNSIPLALLPGDDKPDPELARLSTVPSAACHRLWRYLAEGGPGNAENFLRFAASLLDTPSLTSLRKPGREGWGMEAKLRSGVIRRTGPNRRRCCVPGCTGRGAPPRAVPRSRPGGAAMAASSRLCSIGRLCSPATRRRSMRWCGR